MTPSWRVAGAAAFCVVVGWISVVRGQQVPVLAQVDLGFHELGHLVSYVFPDLITAVMGSVTQVAVPLGLAAYFGFSRHEPPSAAVCLAWAGESARGVSVYIADAPFERLELIGGDHDWAFILSDLNHLRWAAGLATAVKLLGMLLVLGGLFLCGWQATAPQRAERPSLRA